MLLFNIRHIITIKYIYIYIYLFIHIEDLHRTRKQKRERERDFYQKMKKEGERKADR